MTHDSQPAEAADSVNFECDLDAPPAQVWRALTEPELLAAWLEPDAIEHSGAGLRLDYGKEGLSVELETLSQEPHRLLRLRWRSVDRESGLPDLDSVVTFELTETNAGGTHLRIAHDAFAVSLARPAPQRAFARRSAIAGVHGVLRRRSRGGATIMRLAA